MSQPRIIGKDSLIFLMAGLLIVGFLATSLASYFVSRSAVRNEIILHELPLTSDNIFSEIQKDLIRPIFISSMMANDTFLKDWILEGEKNVDEIARYLKEVKVRFNAFSSFYVSEKTRNYYYPGGILEDIREDDPRDAWYFRVRQMSDPYETNIDPDLANDDSLTVFINYKVFDYGGNYIGTTGVGLAMEALQKTIESYQNRFERRIYFVTPQGNIALSSRPQDTPEARRSSILDDEYLAPIFDDIRRQNEGDFEYSRDGDTFFLKTRYMPELGWYLFVEKSDAQAISALQRTLFFNLTICLFITMVTLVTLKKTFNRYQEKLEIMATTDKLTGVLNRQALDLISEQAMKNAGRSNTPLSVIIFDIDKLKEINDSHGHLAGDSVIRHVAATAQKTLRDSDVICRWGGDEFILLLQDCNLKSARTLSEKIYAALENNDARHKNMIIPTSVSMGIAQYHNGESEDDFFARADKVLYMAKLGKNQKLGVA